MSKVYVVKFKDGFYAKNQPHYDWNFVSDASKALLYKSVGNAMKRKNDPGSYGKGEIYKYDIETGEIIENTIKDQIDQEVKRLTKKFKKQCIADGDDWEEVLDMRIKKFIKRM